MIQSSLKAFVTTTHDDLFTNEMSESAINKKEFPKRNSMIDGKEEQKSSYQCLIKNRNSDRKNKICNRKHINDCLCNNKEDCVTADHLPNSNLNTKKNSYTFWNKLIEILKLTSKFKKKNSLLRMFSNHDKFVPNPSSDTEFSSFRENTPSTDDLDNLCVFDKNFKLRNPCNKKNDILLINVKLSLKKLNYNFGSLEKIDKKKKNCSIHINKASKTTPKDKKKIPMVDEAANSLIYGKESYLSLPDNFSFQTTDIISKRTESESRFTEDVISSEEEEVDKEKNNDNLEKLDILDFRESLINSSNSQGSNSNSEQRSDGLIYDDPLHSKYEPNSDKESCKQISVQTYNLDSMQNIKQGIKLFKDKDNDNISLGFIGNNLLTHTLIIAFKNSSKKSPTTIILFIL